MSGFKIKRVYETAVADDGYRLLADRLWPRGISKANAAIDEWNKEIAPSPELRKWFDHRPERFDKFREAYEQELLLHKNELNRLRTLAAGTTVCLLYGAKSTTINHAVVLLNVLMKGG